jgi:hemerythrin
MNSETLHALKSWFIVHVAHSDRQFADWLSDRDMPAARRDQIGARGKPLY